MHKKPELALPLNRLRVVAVLVRYPVHRLSRQGAVRIAIRETDADGALAVRWEVGWHSEYGQGGLLAYKLDTQIVARKLDGVGRPIPGVIRLGSLSDLCRELDLADSGKNRGDLRRALLQNASAFITAKIHYKTRDGVARWIEIGGTRYTVAFAGERVPGGGKADAVCLVLNDFFREILDHGQTRPLDFDYLCGLPPTAQRLYELLSYPMFGALSRGRPEVRMRYSEFCTYAPQMRSTSFGPMRKQMEKIHAPHRRSGYITGVEYEATTDREGRADWAMIYTPGPKAKAEYQAFTRKGGPVAPEAEPAQPEPEPEPTGLERELIDRGVTPAKARELVRDYSEDRIKAQIENLDRTRRKIRDKAAYLVSAIREDFATSKAIDPPVKAEPVPVARTPKSVVDAYWRSLSPDERTALDAAALAQADPAIRAEIEGESRPSMRRLLMSAVRDAHLQSILNVPVVG